MKRNPACTMRDLASHLGISHSTVSRALRNDPRITESVRLSVIKAANKLGYKRDPKLSQLMSHVRATKERAFQGTLAWITDHNVSNPAELAPHLLYWESAVQCALKLGYKLECYPNTRPEDAPRLERKLRALGIQGIVIQQFKDVFNLPSWKFDWERFAIVHNGSCQATPSLDSVDADDVGNCVRVFAGLSKLGYKRIGICTTRAIELANNYSMCAARQRFAMAQVGQPDIPPCLLPDLGPESAQVAKQWIETHQIDAVASQVRGMKEMLESIGYRVPDDLGLAYQAINPHGPNTGVWQREDILAGVIIEALVASVEQGRFGLPSTPRVTMIPGVWHEGTTAGKVQAK